MSKDYIEFTKKEAVQMGAFEEDALSIEDCIEDDVKVDYADDDERNE